MRFIFTLLGLCFCSLLDAQTQTIVTGQVTSATTGEPLIGATVQVLSNLSGQNTTTDENGFYKFGVETVNDSKIPTLQIFVSYVGFQMAEKIVTPEKNSIVVNFQLITSVLEEIVITGSQNAKKIEDEPVSIEIIKPDYIARSNVTQLSEIMERVPGVQLVDNQVNIRNSGYSLGAGSRVGIVIDGQPLLSALAGDIRWNFIPIENAAQIEVLKGASSVLYGSAAMNGVINIQTAWPSSKPHLDISYYTGRFDEPINTYRQWWAGTDIQPMNQGVFMSYRSKFDKLDVVVGGNFHESVGYLKDLDEQRFRFNWKTRYRLTDKINFGINGNIMNHKERTWLVWQDADTNALSHIGPYAATPITTFSIDPFLNIYDDFGNKHEFTGRYFNFTTYHLNGATPSPANVTNLEYKFKTTFKEKITMTLGTNYQYIFGESLSGNTDTSSTVFTTNAQVLAVFGQADANFFNDKLNIIAGIRGESINAGDGTYTAVIPVSRLSAMYKLNPTSRLRFNVGQGYRVPSLIERFLQTPLLSTGVDFLPTIDLLPNPSVLPEVGWSIELGYKRLFKGTSWNGYIDLALFNMNYQSLAELTFGYHGEPNTALDLDQIGFKTINTSPGRIAGVELSSYINTKIANIPTRFWGGYTYTYPADLDTLANNNMSYFANFFQAFNNVDSTLAETILRYRSLHTARLDVQFDFKPVSLGFAARYNGYMWKIDDVFVGKGIYAELVEGLLGGELIPGFKDYRAATQEEGGTWVFDFRSSVDLHKNVRLHFIVNNVFNKEYAIRPGRMNPMRNFNMKCQLMF